MALKKKLLLSIFGGERESENIYVRCWQDIVKHSGSAGGCRTKRPDLNETPRRKIMTFLKDKSCG